MNGSAPSPDFSYSGGANLEVMAEAHNYNAFLLGLVRQTCGQNVRILDFGAGSGTIAELVRERGYTVSCVEPDPRQAESLRERGFATVLSCDELAPGSFDAIYSLNVLEHTLDDHAAVSDLLCLLRPGGRFLAYVPAFACLFGAMDRKVGHHRRYRRTSLSQLVTGAGFTLDRCAYADSLGFFATLLFNAVASDEGTLNPAAVKIYDRVTFPVSKLIDRAVCRYFGKNVYAVAHKPLDQDSAS